MILDRSFSSSFIIRPSQSTVFYIYKKGTGIKQGVCDCNEPKTKQLNYFKACMQMETVLYNDFGGHCIG